MRAGIRMIIYIIDIHKYINGKCSEENILNFDLKPQRHSRTCSYNHQANYTSVNTEAEG